MELKEKLLKIEEEFDNYKNNIEKIHKFILIIYFVPSLIGILFYYKYYKTIDNESSIYIKIIIFAIILTALFFHFLFRYIFQKSKKRYKKFIIDRMNKIKINYKDEEKFKKEVINNTRQIFTQRDLTLSNATIRETAFWNLLFIYLGIEFDDD